MLKSCKLYSSVSSHDSELVSKSRPRPGGSAHFCGVDDAPFKVSEGAVKADRDAEWDAALPVYKVKVCRPPFSFTIRNKMLSVFRVQKKRDTKREMERGFFK